MYTPKMKKSEVFRRAIELLLDDYMRNDCVTPEQMFNSLRDMFLYYEKEAYLEELEEEE